MENKKNHFPETLRFGSLGGKRPQDSLKKGLIYNVTRLRRGEFHTKKENESIELNYILFINKYTQSHIHARIYGKIIYTLVRIIL